MTVGILLKVKINITSTFKIDDGPIRGDVRCWHAGIIMSHMVCVQKVEKSLSAVFLNTYSKVPFFFQKQKNFDECNSYYFYRFQNSLQTTF